MKIVVENGFTPALKCSFSYARGVMINVRIGKRFRRVRT